MEERQSRLSSMVWKRFLPYLCVRLIPQNLMFSNFCHLLNLIIHEFSLSIILGLCQLNIAYVLFIVICLVKKIICIIRKCDSKNIKPHKRNNCCYKNRLTQILIKVLIIIICVCMIVLDIVTGCYLFIHLTLWGDFNVFAIHCFCITLIYIYSIIMASIIIIKKLHPYVDNKHS